MQRKRVEILGVSICIDSYTGQYRAIYSYTGGRIFRRLGIHPSEGVTSFEDEKPEVIMQVVNASNIISNQLSDEGAFSKRGRYLFKDAMEEYLEWHEKHRNDPGIRNRAKSSLEQFGRKRLNTISRDDVREWLEEISEQYSHITIRNRIGVAKACINWHIKEGRYDGRNPFEGHEWKAKGKPSEVKPTITMAELQYALSCTSSQQVIQSMLIAYFTGARPSEAYRVRPEDFDHEKLILRIREAKKRTESFRLIAIPKALSIWIVNNGVVEVNGKVVENIISTMKQSEPSLAGVTMSSLRKNFSSIMELAGADHERIDAHQGRFQSTVIKKHYLRDKMRAVNLMKSYINKVFDNGDDGHTLRLVK